MYLFLDASFLNQGTSNQTNLKISKKKKKNHQNVNKITLKLMNS
jgi:hypothetical protein